VVLSHISTPHPFCGSRSGTERVPPSAWPPQLPPHSEVTKALLMSVNQPPPPPPLPKIGVLLVRGVLLWETNLLLPSSPVDFDAQPLRGGRAFFRFPAIPFFFVQIHEKIPLFLSFLRGAASSRLFPPFTVEVTRIPHPSFFSRRFPCAGEIVVFSSAAPLRAFSHPPFPHTLEPFFFFFFSIPDQIPLFARLTFLLPVPFFSRNVPP